MSERNRMMTDDFRSVSEDYADFLLYADSRRTDLAHFDLTKIIARLLFLIARRILGEPGDKTSDTRQHPFKRDWVKCPICHEPDMPRVWQQDEEDGPYITCLNTSCPSNVVKNGEIE